MHEGGRMMWMWFHTKLNDTLLFKSWWIHDPGKMVWSCLVVAVLAVVLEALRWLRWVAQIRRAEEKTWYSHMLNSAQYLDTLLYFAQSVLAYTLMLSFMTFSVWICLSLCIGLTIGHYLFGVKRFKLTS